MMMYDDVTLMMLRVGGWYCGMLTFMYTFALTPWKLLCSVVRFLSKNLPQRLVQEV